MRSPGKHPSMDRVEQLQQKGARQHLELAAKVGSLLYRVLVLYPGELQEQGYIMHQGTRKPPRPGITWLHWILSKETPRSHCMKLEKQDQRYSGDSNVLEIPGTWDIYQLKLQTQSIVSLRQRLCVTKLERCPCSLMPM